MVSTDSPLPTALTKVLRLLPPTPVFHLASSLSSLLNHLDGFSSTGPSAGPTACAIFIFALEGQMGSSLPSYIKLAQELGVKAGTRKNLVIERYRDISKILEHWMVDVPWFSGADHPDNKLGTKRRKISRRDVIASGIRDIIQFREDILKAQKSRESEEPLTVALEVAEESDDSESNLVGLSRAGRKRKRFEGSTSSQSSRSVRLIRSCPAKSSVSLVDLASLSLLSPSHPFSPDLLSPETPEGSCQTDSLQNRILTSSNFPSDLERTRLQQLVTSRGGESDIGDDELFDQDELESFLRSDDEVKKLRSIFGWDESNPSVDDHKQGSPSSSQAINWDLADLTVWEGFGSNKDVDCQSEEQILGEWREASPSSRNADERGDDSDVCEW